MKKVFKIIEIIVLSLLILNISIFAVARYGWKLFGFNLCENPEVLNIGTVYVTDDKVHITGNTMSSASSFVGYTYKIKDRTLYIGIKQNLLAGFLSRNGAYSIVIDDVQDIDHVMLMGKNSDGECIWSENEDGKYLEKIKNVRLYKTISSAKDVECSEDYIYADAELLERIRHAEFKYGLYISKGTGYIGVAELENGKEMYLEFERHYDDFSIIGKLGCYSY